MSDCGQTNIEFLPYELGSCAPVQFAENGNRYCQSCGVKMTPIHVKILLTCQKHEAEELLDRFESDSGYCEYGLIRIG